MFDCHGLRRSAAKTKSDAHRATVEEWTKDERLAHEKELLGFYVTGHPLDKFRSVHRLRQIPQARPASTISIYPTRASASRSPGWSARWTQDHQDRQALRRAGRSKISPAAPKSCCGAKPSSPPATPALLEPGKIIKLKGNIQVDDRTGGRRITGYELAELKPRGASATKGPLELMLWTTRHSERDLHEISDALAEHPGKVPVLLHFQNSAGKRATLELGDKYGVRRSEVLEKTLGRWMD